MRTSRASPFFIAKAECLSLSHPRIIAYAAWIKRNLEA